MNILLDEHKKLIVQLLKRKVDFILVGGYAVIYHGYLRTTGDMDIWLKPDNVNKDKLIPVLREQGILEDDIKLLQTTEFSRPVVFHIGDPPYRIDFLTSLTGLKYDEADKEKVFFAMDNYLVPILHLNHLIINKLLSGRTKDKADVEELQKIIRLKKS